MHHAVFLDAGSVGEDLDFSRLQATAEHWSWHAHTPSAEVAQRLAGADLALINKVILDAEAFASAPALRLVCVCATGVNNVDLEAARRHGVTVCNATGYGTPAVVQHVFALLLALATNLPAFRDDVRAGHWQRSLHFCPLDHPITELSGRTLGIIGHGELGSAVAQVARAFGMEVLVAARPGSRDVPAGRVPLAELLERADAISIHCPLTDATRGLIGSAELARMKRTAFLVNTARGGIVDEAALAAALQGGTIAGAGIDVLTREPPVDGNPLLDPTIPNLIVTPHSAWATHAARQRLMDQVAANIKAFAGGRPRNVVTGPDQGHR